MPDPTTPPPASPSPAPVPSSTVAPAVKSYKGMAVTSWILVIFTGLLAIVPVFGYVSALLVWIVAPLVIIFAIVILTRRGTAQGIFLILLAILSIPWSFLAPTISTLLLGASISAKETAQQDQIVANLNKIDTAKQTWATETSASNGAAVTMSDLTKYLGGSEIKPIVGETYEPHAVGEPASAKLPANKSLASHKAGEEITAASASTSTAASTSTSTTSATSPSASPTPTPEEEE